MSATIVTPPNARAQECGSCFSANIPIDRTTCPNCGSGELRPLTAIPCPQVLRTFDTLTEQERNSVFQGINGYVHDLTEWFLSQNTPPTIALIAAEVFSMMSRSAKEERVLQAEEVAARIAELWDRYITPLDLAKGGNA